VRVGRALWYTDGTREGTHLVEGFAPGAEAWPQELTRIGDTLYFTARDFQHGRELWEMDVSS
jgi:ELWxxDGT repeat protein